MKRIVLQLAHNIKVPLSNNQFFSEALMNANIDDQKEQLLSYSKPTSLI